MVLQNDVRFISSPRENAIDALREGTNELQALLFDKPRMFIRDVTLKLADEMGEYYLVAYLEDFDHPLDGELSESQR